MKVVLPEPEPPVIPIRKGFAMGAKIAPDLSRLVAFPPRNSAGRELPAVEEPSKPR